MKIKELFEEQTEAQKTTSALIDKWLELPASTLSSQHKLALKGYTYIYPDGSISIHHPHQLIILDEMLDENGEFPVEIANVSSIIVAASNITSFKNFPKEIKTQLSSSFPVKKAIDFKYATCEKLTSFEHFPSTIFGSLVIGFRTPNLNFSRIDRYIKEMTGSIFISGKYKGPLLSLLRIKGEIILMSQETDNDIIDVIRIINNHLDTRDILACQDELIENGFKEYAKL